MHSPNTVASGFDATCEQLIREQTQKRKNLNLQTDKDLL